MGKRRKINQKANKKRASPAWKDIVKENYALEKYYKDQDILSPSEWDEFIKFCRKDLPSTFRITKIRGHAKDLLKSLKEGYINKITTEDVKCSIPQEKTQENPENEQDLFLEPISWYPDDLAWSSNLSRRFIRRSEILNKLHRFLVEDSECGAITRQEAVSMIPPMLLDVLPHHLVLDMCAAPGSKTAQIIELMHADNGVPTGAVIANDADHKRCYMLTHQAKRLNTPCVIITNHDASIFPKLYMKNDEGGVNSVSFDRVLCDVPCSGDGTLRKNPLIWSRWSSHMAVGLHRLQIRILIRGLELLKVGGRLVYSTCSFNPIENEAVLASVLSKVDNSIELVDCKSQIPLLKRKPGLLTWKVFDKQGNEFKTFHDVNCSPTYGYKESMFPPTPSEAQDIHLERCMRVYPHLQNTGGFFIAVLEKKRDLPWINLNKGLLHKTLPWEVKSKDDEKDSKKQNEDFHKDEGSSKESSPAVKKFKRGMIKEDPYIFLLDDDEDLTAVRDFYELSKNLPSGQFLVRSTGASRKRHIYLVSESVQKIIKENNNIKIINTGVRIVTRSPFKAGTQNHGVEYRLVQEGIYLISRFIKKRIVNIQHSDMLSLLSSNDVEFSSLADKTQASLKELDMGCVVWKFNAGDSQLVSSDMFFCGHQGRKVVQCMLNKEERKHFLRLLGAKIPEELEIKLKGPSWGDSEDDGREGAMKTDTLTDEANN